MALREEISLEALEAPDRLVEEPMDLGDVPADRKNFGPETVSNRGSHLGRNRGLELCRSHCQSFQLVA